MFNLFQNPNNIPNIPSTPSTPSSSSTPQVNPQQIALVKNMLSQKGISAETWVRQLCSQRGINVDEFMEQFRDVNI